MRVSLYAIVSSPTVSRRLAPRGHHVADVRVHQRRFDARDDNPLIGEDARDAHRAREAKQDAREILIGDRDDVLLIVDDDELRKTFQTMKRALALAHAERSGHRWCDAPHLFSLSTPDQVCGD